MSDLLSSFSLVSQSVFRWPDLSSTLFSTGEQDTRVKNRRKFPGKIGTKEVDLRDLSVHSCTRRYGLPLVVWFNRVQSGGGTGRHRFHGTE